ncbi:MAG: nitronate monooxygenase [Proteobacteria bacterium]|nr:nitronate monooxygenase [Pseudomonadota bacterium]MBU4471715.1 nitronate monooxygenase [Pseudomonadota bacterium]MCG2750689.1 nitronate monooxygenase [Desulfobacteraceae bacterium]
MLKTELCEILGIKYPIFQAGMGPFSNNKLGIASANAGVLGLLSTSGLNSRVSQTEIFNHFAITGGADPAKDDDETILRKIFRQTYNGVKEKKGVFGVNVMVSAEMMDLANKIINTAIECRNEEPELRNHFRVVFTSAGDPMPWGEKIKGAGFKWIHIVPSVKGAERCRKAGVDIIVASGHEGGFHTSWEPVHSMVLLPAVVDAMAGSGIPVVGAGGFCDGKSLVAALALGASGVQMGTRFLATKESDFADTWKEGIVKAGDRDTIVARGFVGPARWIRTPNSLKHQENTLRLSPGLFLGKPDDPTSDASKELIAFEREGMRAVFRGDTENALIAGGECAQRVTSLLSVQELVDGIVAEATDIITRMPKKYL